MEESVCASAMPNEDIMGELLPRLDDDDIMNALLCCKAWRSAIQHQIRALRPLYIPPSPPLGYHSLEQLQLPLIRPARTQNICTADAPRSLTSLAPLRNISGVSGFWHASTVNLGGQVLPYNTLQLLSKHMPRLKSLQLDACHIAAGALLHATGLTALHHLSLAGINITANIFNDSKQLQQQAVTLLTQNPFAALTFAIHTADAAYAEDCVVSDANGVGARGQRNAAGDWVAAAAADAPAAAAAGRRSESLTAVERGLLLDAVLLPQLQRLNLDIDTKPQVLPYVNSPVTATQPAGLFIKGHASKLAALTQLQQLSLADNGFGAEEWECMCDALGRNLKELHILWDAQDDPDLNDQSFSKISQLTQLHSLSLTLPNVTNQSIHAEYCIAALADHLTCLRFTSGWQNMQLLMSIASCTKLVRLELSGLKEPFQDQYLVQVVRSMPLLESLSVRNLHPTARLDYVLCPPGDQLLCQLSSICPKLKQLLLPDVPLEGRGLKLAALGCAASDAAIHTDGSTTAAAAAAAAAVSGGVCGLRQVQQLELCCTRLMRSTLPHMSYLVGLRSLTLYGMPLQEFPHACRLNCFVPLSNLQHLTSLRILPVPDEQVGFHKLPPYAPGQVGFGNMLPGQPQQFVQMMLQNVGNQQQAIQQQLAQQQNGAADPLLQDWAQNLQQAMNHMVAINGVMQGAMGVEMPAVADAVAAVNAAAGAVDAAAAAANNDEIIGGNEQEIAEASDEDESSDIESDNESDDADGFAAEQQQQQQQQQEALPQQQQQAVPPPWLKRLSFEPHLHFLSGLPSLVELELGCLQTSGVALLHLHSLPKLRSLTLGGNITVNESSWQFLLQLHLPHVTQLSLTGCKFVDSSSSSAGVTGSSNADMLAALLTRSFPNCVNLEFGSCRSMSYAGFEMLLLELRNLKVLRLLGVKDLKLAEASGAPSSSSSSSSGSSSVLSAVYQWIQSIRPSCQHDQHVHVPYLDSVMQKYKALNGPNAQLTLNCLEVSEEAYCIPQSGLEVMAAAAKAPVGLYGPAPGYVKTLRGRCIVLTKFEGQMVPV